MGVRKLLIHTTSIGCARSLAALNVPTRILTAETDLAKSRHLAYPAAQVHGESWQPRKANKHAASGGFLGPKPAEFPNNSR